MLVVGIASSAVLAFGASKFGRRANGLAWRLGVAPVLSSVRGTMVRTRVEDPPSFCSLYGRSIVRR